MNRKSFNETPFEPKIIDRTQEGQIAFVAFVPSEIEEGDCDGKWWPTHMGFPFNIVYSSTRPARNARFAVATALYVPDLETFHESETEREMTYLNKLGGPYRVRVVLIKGGGIETCKYRGDELIAVARGKEFNTTMTQTTMIGIQEDEPADMFLVERSS